MTSQKIYSPRIITAAALLLAAATAAPAFAQFPYQYGKKAAQESPRPAASPERSADQMKRMANRADREIDQRVARLNLLSARIQGMKKLTDTDKTNLVNTLKTEIAALTALKTKIAADTDTETLRTDMQSVTKAYRIYALIMPQIAILAAADRASVISDALTTVSQKLQTRMAAAQTAGNNVTSLQTMLADMTAKIADARDQAQSARQEVAGLTADNGDQAKFDANKQALKDAHEKIKTAMKDLEAARKDAQDIAKGLRTFARPSHSPSPSASASPAPSNS